MVERQKRNSRMTRIYANVSGVASMRRRVGIGEDFRGKFAECVGRSCPHLRVRVAEASDENGDCGLCVCAKTCQNRDWVITSLAVVTRYNLGQCRHGFGADVSEASSAAHDTFVARRLDCQACKAGYRGTCNRSEDTEAVFCVDRMSAAGHDRAEFGLQSGRIVTGPLEQCGEGVCADLADRFPGFGRW